MIDYVGSDYEMVTMGFIFMGAMAVLFILSMSGLAIGAALEKLGIIKLRNASNEDNT